MGEGISENMWYKETLCILKNKLCLESAWFLQKSCLTKFLDFVEKMKWVVTIGLTTDIVHLDFQKALDLTKGHWVSVE